MKHKKFALMIPAMLLLLASTPMLEGIEAHAANVFYEAKSTFQCNHVRYDGTRATAIATYWQADPFPTAIGSMSYGRLILNAPSAAAYTLGLDYAAGSYPIKVFTNGVESDYTLPDNGWSVSTYTFDVSLNAGNNVVIIAFNSWGAITGINIPDTLTVVGDDHTGGIYHANYAELRATNLYVASGSIHEANATVYTGPLNYDSNDEYASKALFKVNAGASTSSIALSYYVTGYSDGLAELSIAVNEGTPFTISVYETLAYTVNTISIPSATLTTAGFVAGAANTISIKESSGGSGSVGLVSLTLSDTAVLSYSSTRLEAESGTRNGGSIQTGDAIWSNSSYLGDMGTKTTLSGPEAILDDLSNVNSVDFSYSALQEGLFQISLAYATQVSGTAYLRVDKGPWQTFSFSDTTGWATPAIAQLSVLMNAGARTLTLTGTVTSGSWVNYDFIDVVEIRSGSAEESALAYATFFRDSTSAGCAAHSVSQIPWANLKSEYLNLSVDAKNAFVVSENTTIADARARYQVLIDAYPTLENWLVNGSGSLVYSAADSFLFTNPDSGPFVLGFIAIFGLVLFIGWTLYKTNRKQEN